MRVGVDARHLAGIRGVAHYTDALLDALAGGHPDDEWVLLVPGRASLPPGLAAPVHANVVLRRHPLPSRALFGAGAVTGVPRLDRLLGGRLDVVWAPAPAPLALSSGVPFVLTVHDLSFEERSRDFTPYERAWHRLARPRRLVSRADRVIVDSAATGRALTARWSVAPHRVDVVAPGVRRPSSPPTLDAVAAARTRHGVAERYLLAVGALEPRKAPDLLVRAHARARAAGLDAELVFAGSGRLAGRLRSPGVRVLGHVAGTELDALYAGALALVMPSWLEGFGLPPLEAAARGTPAVVSDLPVYEETLGDGALRFPPGDEEALGRALARIAADAQLRRRLLSAAVESISRLTWENTARAARQVLAEAAGAG